jgi:hypothetical protein
MTQVTVKTQETDWFPPEIKPKYKGVYRTRFIGVQGFAYWDGRRWSHQHHSLRVMEWARHAGAHQRKEWRGLAEKPE